MKNQKLVGMIFIILVFMFDLKGSCQIPGFRYIDYNFENGSPLFWEIQEDSSILVSLMYDHEWNSPNRATLHWHFLVFAVKDSALKIILQNFDNIYNGHYSSPLKENTSCYISVDGMKWTNIPTYKNSKNQ